MSDPSKNIKNKKKLLIEKTKPQTIKINKIQNLKLLIGTSPQKSLSLHINLITTTKVNIIIINELIESSINQSLNINK